MCGIAGVVSCRELVPDPERIVAIVGEIGHRGPDDRGLVTIGVGGETVREWALPGSSPECAGRMPVYTGDGYSVALGHARLSIIDLSIHGHQPMTNEDRTLWLTYNGEIYNYPELMKELTAAGHVFISRTDSEVILHAYEEWGTGCLERFNGMFAFALWDQNASTLFAARDRFGIKPFYYCCEDNQFEFASEIKSLIKNRPDRQTGDPETIWRFLAREERNTTDYTFFKKVRQLAPAHYLIFKEGSVKKRRYWDLQPGIDDTYDFQQASDRFRQVFYDSIERHMRSDVPVSFCLSGGLDSSSIVSVVHERACKGMKKQENGLQTFSSCFEDRRFDERVWIEELVRKWQINTNYLFPDATGLLDDLDKFLHHQDEPCGGISVYAQWCVMKKIHDSGIKVVLDGQGGDEILAGYPRFWVPRLQDAFSLNNMAGFTGEFIRTRDYLHMSSGRLARHLVKKTIPALEYRVDRRKDFKSLYPWIHPGFQCCGKNSSSIDTVRRFNEHIQEASYNELFKIHLQGLLHYEDRNSMAFSIESRVPFLDTRLVETVFAMPGIYKLFKGETKRVMRRALRGTVPDPILDRRDKMGFVTPGEAVWLKKDLRSWASGIIESSRFAERPFWDAGYMRKGFANGTISGGLLWRCINLELWMRYFHISM